jgi:hypothetical protein
MRTGSFHRTISPARHLAMPRPPALTHNFNPSSGSMDNARVDWSSKSPDLAVAYRATFPDHQDQ